jgi:hypothetical protein
MLISCSRRQIRATQSSWMAKIEAGGDRVWHAGRPRIWERRELRRSGSMMEMGKGAPGPRRICCCVECAEKRDKRKGKKFGLSGETFRRHRVWRKLYGESTRGGVAH